MYIRLLLIFMLALPFGLEAQKSVIGRKILTRPQKYTEAPDGSILSSDSQTREGGVGNLYIVYSDRDNNPTYELGKEGAAAKDKLKFEQPLFVIEFNEGYLHVVEYNSRSAYDPKTNKITRELKDYGWIPKNKVLLWQNALIDPKTRFTMKCLAVNQIAALQDPAKYAQSEMLKLYNSPAFGVENGTDVRLYNFLYIYKQEGDYFLIGKGNRFNPFEVENELLGWVHKNTIQVWSQRLALEPTATPGGHERKGTGLDIRFYTSEKDAQAYALKGKQASGGTKIPFDDTYERAFPAEWKRFPVITPPNDATGVVHTGLVSKVFNEDGQEIMGLEEQFEVSKEYEKSRKNREKVNIVFVMDGSRNMQQYAAPVAQAIKSATDNIRGQLGETAAGEGMRFEFGAVVYRSLAEEACGNKVIMKKDLTINEQEIINFLVDEIKKEDCSSTGDYKAVLRGLSEGLKMFRTKGRSEQTNIIILIGGEGNDPADLSVSVESVIKSVVDVGCSLMSFQAKRIEAPSYSQFLNDIRDISKGSAEKLRETYKDKSPGSGAIQFVDGSHDNLLLLNYPEAAPVPCSFLYAELMRPMNVDQLRDEIEKIVDKTVKNNQMLFAVGDAKVNGMGERYDMNEATRFFFSQMNIDPDLLAKVSDRNIQFFIEGYTPLRIKGLESDPFKYVILVEDSEYAKLLDDFRKLTLEGRDISTVREDIVNAYKTLLSSQFGAKESKSMIEQLTVEELNGLLSGLPGTKGRSKLLDFRLAELEKMDENQIIKIRDHFNAQYNKLEGFRNVPENGFMNTGLRYYWIPQDILP